jgi:hypothetical protein
VFYIGLLVIIMISCFAWFQWPRASFAGTNLSFFGVKRYLQGLNEVLTEEEEEGCARLEPASIRHQNVGRGDISNSDLLSGRIDWWATTHKKRRDAWSRNEEQEEKEEEETAAVQTQLSQLQVPLLWSSVPTTLCTPPSMEMRIPPKTGQRCIEASTMHTIVDHVQKHSRPRQGNTTYKLTLDNVGLEAGSLKPLAIFLAGYLRLKSGCCTNSMSSEVAVLYNDAQECCINPHSFICFCCFPKPQDIQNGLCNCLRCTSKHAQKCWITSLSLASNELGRKPKALLLIRDMLKGNNSLTHFDISNNGLGAKGGRLIADGLCQ